MGVSCAICMNSFDEHLESDIVAIKCGHTFHRSCISEWKTSSKQMTCPECRTKYTERSLKKLYLNIIPKSEDFQTDGLFEQLQEQRKLVSALKQDKERLMYNNKNIQEEAKKTREDFIKLSQTTKELQETHAIKCEAYSIVNVINDQYINQNEELRHENVSLKRKLQAVEEEMESKKAKAVTLAKPFVDLTNDDADSDVEIIEGDPPKPCIVEDDSESELDVTIENIEAAMESFQSNTDKSALPIEDCSDSLLPMFDLPLDAL